MTQQLQDTRTDEIVGGRYLVESRIGKGGHGEVYEALDLDTERRLAIKFLAPHLANDDAYRLRLVREARAMSALGGLSTVEILAVIGAEDGTPCVVMELLEGVDLLQALKDRVQAGSCFSPSEVVTMFMPIVKTLDAAHARDIIHRDIKPSNIFLVNGGVNDVRIMDFGLAKTGDLTSITADQMLAGSPSYIAPEVWKKGAKAADRRSDVYSLACVIFQTLGGDVPIYRDSLADMLVAVLEDPRPSLFAMRPDLPEAIDDWVKQALAIDPNNRFQTVIALWRAFRSTLEL